MPIAYGQCKGRKYPNVQTPYEPPEQVDKTKNKKKCTRCHRVLPLYEFYRDYSSTDGYQTICADCQRKRRSKKKK